MLLRISNRQPAPPAAGCVAAVLSQPEAARGDAALLAYVAAGAAVVAPLLGDAQGAPAVLRPPTAAVASGGGAASAAAAAPPRVSALHWAPAGGALAVAAGASVDVHAPTGGVPVAGCDWRHDGCAEAGAHDVVGARREHKPSSPARANAPPPVAARRRDTRVADVCLRAPPTAQLQPCPGARTARRCCCATPAAAWACGAAPPLRLPPPLPPRRVARARRRHRAPARRWVPGSAHGAAAPPRRRRVPSLGSPCRMPPPLSQVPLVFVLLCITRRSRAPLPAPGRRRRRRGRT
jgi:hypothetical protein